MERQVPGRGLRIVIKDLSHMLLNAQGEASRSCGCSANDGPWTAPQAVRRGAAGDDEADIGGRGFYWNLFAFPVALESGRYAFLTDRRSVVSVDEQTFKDIQGARGRAIPQAVSDRQALDMLEAGLVSREPPSRQFAEVFERKVAAPRENALLHLITSYTCNLTCSYCFMLADLDDHQERFLSFEDARRGIDVYFSMPYKKEQRDPLLWRRAAAAPATHR
jgi:hypothetical protein